jgi:hypothetical protein
MNLQFIVWFKHLQKILGVKKYFKVFNFPCYVMNLQFIVWFKHLQKILGVKKYFKVFNFPC